MQLGASTKVWHRRWTLLQLGKTSKQAIKKLVSAWLLRLWDMGTDGIHLTVLEAENLSNDPRLLKIKEVIRH